MFYAPNVLGKKSVLGPVWLAAHHDVQKKLTKLQINSYNVSDFTDQIQKQDEEDAMALRLSSFLLIGVSRIFSQKVHILLQDCNEAYTKITLAFKPSNVDMAPISRNQAIKAITDSNLVEDTGISGLDLDLELNLTDADWAAGGDRLSQSQASWADITLPDVVTQGTDEGKLWEEEDPLFYGGAMEAGDNPLDLNYDLDAEQLRDEMVEDPEIRRDSDGSSLRAPPGRESGFDGMDAGELDMPDVDFEPETAAARESEAHKLSMGDDEAGAPTPLRLSENGELEFDSPNLEMKLPKKAKKGKANLKKDKTTNVDTEVYKKWISDPESVKDICRPPRPVASSRHEAKGRRYHKLAGQSKLVETLVREPLQAYMGKRLTALYVDLAERGQVASNDDERVHTLEDSAGKSASKKRKSRDLDEEDVAHVAAFDEMEEVDPALPADGDMPEIEIDHEPIPQARPSGVEDDSFGGFAGVEIGEDDGEEGEEGGDAEGAAEENRLTERTKKAIVKLQQEYAALPNPRQSLSYKKIMQPVPEAPRPTRTQAAVAFFELLHLHAKGFVKLDQPQAYSDIAIASTEQLHRFKA